MNGGRCAVLWSGGKDSCLALWRARQQEYRVEALINFFDESTERVRFHATRKALVELQAERLGLQLFQYGTSPLSYETVFDAALKDLAERGYVSLVAGDIHLETVRGWNELRAERAGLQLVEPLWHLRGTEILQQFLDAGFHAVITCSDDRWPGALWAGRLIDREFVEQMATVREFDVCGENGEYHSFVYDGPGFSHPIEWATGDTRASNGFMQIDILPKHR